MSTGVEAPRLLPAPAPPLAPPLFAVMGMVVDDEYLEPGG